MKKLFLGICAFAGILFLTACGCSKVDYEVVFSVDGNRTIVTVEKGDVVQQPIDPVKEGYVFVGWFRNLSDPRPYDFTEEVTSNFTLYAKWEKESVCDLKCDDGYKLLNPDSKDCKCEKVETEKEEDEPTQTPTYPSRPVVPSTPEEPSTEPEESKLGYKIEETNSVVGQVKLYLTKDGVIAAGNADIVTNSGKVVNKDIPVTGYVTNGGIIDKVINIKIK